MSSLEATRADGYYYGPDFDPRRHGTLNKFRGVRPPMDKRKGGLQLIRFEMPFHCWCDRCSRIIAKGVRFNATKVCTGMYFSTKILEFSFSCPTCSNALAIATDPKHAEYVCAKGLKKKTDAVDAFKRRKEGGGTHESEIEKEKKKIKQEEEEKKRKTALFSTEEEKEQEEEESTGNSRKKIYCSEGLSSEPSVSSRKHNDIELTEAGEDGCYSSNSSSSRNRSGDATPPSSSAQRRVESSSNSSNNSNSRSTGSGLSICGNSNTRDVMSRVTSARWDATPSFLEKDAPAATGGCYTRSTLEGSQGADMEECIAFPELEERELLRLDPMRKLAYLSTLGPHVQQQQHQRQQEQQSKRISAAATAPASATASAARGGGRGGGAAAAGGGVHEQQNQQQQEEEAAFQAMLDFSSSRHGDPYSVHQLLRQHFLKEREAQKNNKRKRIVQEVDAAGSTTTTTTTTTAAAGERRLDNSSKSSTNASTSLLTPGHRVHVSRSAAPPPPSAAAAAERRAIVAAAAAAAAGASSSSSSLSSSSFSSLLSSPVAAAVAAAADKLDILGAAEDEAAADAAAARRVIFRKEKTELQRYMDKTMRLKSSSILTGKKTSKSQTAAASVLLGRGTHRQHLHITRSSHAKE